MGVKPKQELDRLRNRVTTSDKISSDDQESLIAFSDQLHLLKSEYGLHRHVKLLCHCTCMAEEVGGLTDALESRNATENLIRWINRNHDNEETNRDYRVPPDAAYGDVHTSGLLNTFASNPVGKG